MGLYAVGVVLAPALGPAFGGLMVDGFGWRSVFFLAIPFAVIGLILGLIVMPGPAREGTKRRFDAPGFLLLITALFALLTGLSSGQREGWQSDAVVTELSIAAAAAIAFVWWEWRSPYAMLNPRLFTVRGFACSSLVALVYGATLFGSVYLLPLFVQTVQGYSATRAGLLLMPAGLALLLVFPIAGRIADKSEPWLPIGIGLILFAYSTWLMVDVGTDTPFWTLAIWILIGRIGFGIAMPSMNAGALRSLPPHWVGQGSGAINFARQFGGAMGVNLLSIYLERQTQLYAQALTATQEGRGNTADWLRDAERLLAQEGFADGIRQALAQDYLGRVVLTQASMLAFRDTFTLLVLICVLALGVVAVMRGAKRPA
jgi:EmrB/QacA subfamily drug resistance transporter